MTDEERTMTLDPGIRDIVELIQRLGYTTTDSGDGVSKPADERDFDVPHVVVRFDRGALLFDRAWALHHTLFGAGHRSVVVEASYSTGDGVAVLVVFPAGTKPRETIDTTTEDGQ